MLLENKYYKVLSQRQAEDGTVFHLALLPECEVYKGHFPGNPVSPGVCNIETIKECASMLVGRELRISSIKQCLLTAIASPIVCPEVDVTVKAEDKGETVQVTATIADEKQNYMTFKGELA